MAEELIHERSVSDLRQASSRPSTGCRRRSSSASNRPRISWRNRSSHGPGWTGASDGAAATQLVEARLEPARRRWPAARVPARRRPAPSPMSSSASLASAAERSASVDAQAAAQRHDLRLHRQLALRCSAGGRWRSRRASRLGATAPASGRARDAARAPPSGASAIVFAQRGAHARELALVRGERAAARRTPGTSERAVASLSAADSENACVQSNHWASRCANASGAPGAADVVRAANVRMNVEPVRGVRRDVARQAARHCRSGKKGGVYSRSGRGSGGDLWYARRVAGPGISR